jgi:para-nitrobenzyl esterase
MLDIVAALEWVRDNIEAFGGDPGNVTIFGQSGGGAKVNVLMGMPSAQGLYHKAFNMSGPTQAMLMPAQATAAAEHVLEHLGVQRGEVDELQKVPANGLLKAMTAVEGQVPQFFAGGTWIHHFCPVFETEALPQSPFYPMAPLMSAGVPMLIGNCGGETGRAVPGITAETLASAADSAFRKLLEEMGIDKLHTQALIDAYRATRPHTRSLDVFSDIVADLEFRSVGRRLAERKAALRAAPVYAYLFNWVSPASGAEGKAVHSNDIPFWFDNLDHAPRLAGAPPDLNANLLAESTSKALVAFARTGNPSHPGLPDWKPYTVEERVTMVLDVTPALVDDPRRSDNLAVERAWSQE